MTEGSWICLFLFFHINYVRMPTSSISCAHGPKKTFTQRLRPSERPRSKTTRQTGTPRWPLFRGEGRLSLQRCDVEEVRVDLGCGAACASQVWEDKIQTTGEEAQEAIMFIDGSRGEDGRVAGGWTPSRGENIWRSSLTGLYCIVFAARTEP